MGVNMRFQARLKRFQPNFAPPSSFCGSSQNLPHNSKRQTTAIFKRDKLLYLSNGLTDFDEILCVDACWVGPPHTMVCSKNHFFKSKMAEGRHFEKGSRSTILINLVQQCTIALPTSWATINLKIWKSMMADGGHLKNPKIVVSPKPFGWFWWIWNGNVHWPCQPDWLLKI